MFASPTDGVQEIELSCKALSLYVIDALWAVISGVAGCELGELVDDALGIELAELELFVDGTLFSEADDVTSLNEVLSSKEDSSSELVGGSVL